VKKELKYVIIKTNVTNEGDLYMKRHDAREKAVQVLFQLDNTDLTLQEAIGHVLNEEETDAFFEKLVHGVTEKLQEIDEKLTENLENWSLGRLPKIERTVLRLAVYELQFMKDTPSRVVLNEAIELCKTFGDEKSSKFVNGVLSKFASIQ
jgi:N utilization substance protein B